MWRIILPALTCASVANSGSSVHTGGKSRTPVFQNTPLLIVLDAMVADLYIEPSALVERVLKDLKPTPTRDQAIEETRKARKIILRPTVQPEWFHTALWSYENDIDPKSMDFQDHFWTFAPFGEGDEFTDTNSFKLMVNIWKRYCIVPLRNGEIACGKKENSLPDGTHAMRWALTPQACIDYLGEMLWQQRLKAFS